MRVFHIRRTRPGSLLLARSTDAPTERGLINMRRTMICYGGPRDGETITGEVVPEGYRAFSGSLVVWHTLRIGRLPYWSYGGE